MIASLVTVEGAVRRATLDDIPYVVALSDRFNREVGVHLGQALGENFLAECVSRGVKLVTLRCLSDLHTRGPLGQLWKLCSACVRKRA